MSLIFWAECSTLVLLGSLCAMIPKSGAVCVYGPGAVSFYGWMLTLIVRPYSLSVVARTFVHYVDMSFFPDWEISPIPARKTVEATCLALTMFVNCASIKWAVRFQNMVTYVKMIILAILVVIGLTEVVSGHLHSFKGPFDGTTSNLANTGLAFYLGLCVYDGWMSFNFFVEKMRNLARDLTMVLMIGTPLVIFVFLWTNIAYNSVIGRHGIFNSGAMAMVVGEEKMGPVAWLIPIFVTCSAFGCMNGLAFNGAWLVFASAHINHSPKVLAMVHKTYHTPVASIIFLHVIAMIMLIPDSSEFSMLFNFFSFAAWLSYFAVITALMYLWWKRPFVTRPYKIWLIVPIIANLAVLYLLITSFWQEPKESAMAQLSILPGIPLYFICSRDAWDGCCASSLNHHLSELLSYAVEELKCACKNTSFQRVNLREGFKMLHAKSSEEKLRRKLLWDMLYYHYTIAEKREEDLLVLCRLCLDLSYLFEVEGWRKTYQHMVEERRAEGLMAAIRQHNFQA